MHHTTCVLYMSYVKGLLVLLDVLRCDDSTAWLRTETYFSGCIGILHSWRLNIMCEQSLTNHCVSEDDTFKEYIFKIKY